MSDSAYAAPQRRGDRPSAVARSCSVTAIPTQGSGGRITAQVHRTQGPAASQKSLRVKGF